MKLSKLIKSIARTNGEDEMEVRERFKQNRRKLRKMEEDLYAQNNKEREDFHSAKLLAQPKWVSKK